MRIVTFNIQHGLSAGGSVDTAALAAYCAGMAADVLGLQEVDVGCRRSGAVNQAEEVARGSAMSVFFGRACRVGLRGAYGNALLVRGRLGDLEELALPRVGRNEQRAAVVGRASMAGVDLSVAVTHLSVHRGESRRQLRVVLAALADRPSPRVLLGDLNLSAADVKEEVALAGMDLADPTAPTFPASAPRARIDHIATSGLEVVSVEVPVAAPVSDHRPLVVVAAGL